MIKYLKKHLLSLLIVLIILFQNPIYIFFGNSANIAFALVCILFLILLHKKRTLKKDIFPLLMFVLLPIFILFPMIRGFHMSSIIYLLAFISVFLLYENEKRETIHILTKTFATIILISLPFWFIHVFIYPLPSFGYIDYSAIKGSNYVYANHILFLTLDNELFYRFYSVFDEPGVVGTLSAFILFANKYNFRKWYNVVVLLGGIFTYSMAFYILFVIGLLLSLKNLKSGIPYVILLIPLLFLIYNFLEDDESFQRSVVNRLINYSDSNVDSRTDYDVNKLYDRMKLSSSWLLGIGYDAYENLQIKGQSYKLFIIEYGVLGILALLFMYLSIMKNKSYNSCLLLFLFTLSFLQRPFAFTAWQILLFACVDSNINTKKISSNYA